MRPPELCASASLPSTLVGGAYGAMRRPLIGITTERELARWDVWDADADLVPAAYADMVVAGGGCPVLVPLRAGFEDELVRRLDGLVVTGGPDIAPERYNETAHESVRGLRPDRDAAELPLLDNFIAARRPVLAVCRGAQLLNVSRGGTLIQHLPDVRDSRNHRGEGSTSIQNVVTLVSGSQIAACLGTTVAATCNHHQALNKLGVGVRVVGRAADGVIEAVELDDSRFAIGVQWHPEESGDVRLFRALVMAASSGLQSA